MPLEMCELVPLNATQSAYHGFIRIGDEEFKIQVSKISYLQDNRMDFSTATLQVEPQLAEILDSVVPAVQLCLQRAASLAELVKELKDLITKIMHSKCSSQISLSSSSLSALPSSLISSSSSSQRLHSLGNALPPAAFYTQIVAELDQIGWNHLINMNDQWSEFELQTHDEAQRVHCCRVTLTSNYPTEPPKCAVDAPEEFTLKWQKGFRFSDILRQFEAFLTDFQDFWSVLDDFDAKCCVLEPKTPTKANGKRRIAIAKHASIQIEIDAKQPFGICDLNFFGNEETTSQLRQKWNSNLFQWDDQQKVRKNLQKLLEIQFPKPTQRNQQEFAVECGICYCYRLDNEDQTHKKQRIDANGRSKASSAAMASVIPDRICENVHCNRAFHEKCLLEWLKALPNARQSLNTVFGECPYCREAITARLL